MIHASKYKLLHHIEVWRFVLLIDWVTDHLTWLIFMIIFSCSHLHLCTHTLSHLYLHIQILSHLHFCIHTHTHSHLHLTFIHTNTIALTTTCFTHTYLSYHTHINTNYHPHMRCESFIWSSYRWCKIILT